MIRYKHAVSALFIGSLVATTLGVQGEASADVTSCPQQTGTVRVWDRERNACGFLSVNNADWRTIGNPPWNDRIDEFGNDDFNQHRTMCLYQDIQFKGAKVALPVGFVVTWNNIVSSNRWTTGSC